MAMGKYSRVDGRKSSKWCSTVTIVVFVGLCLVGVWMLMSSSGVPAANSDISAQEPKEVKQKVVEKFSKQYEDSSGDLPEDTGKEEHPESSQDESTSNVEDSQNLLENVEGKNESEEDSKREAETDEDAKSEDNKSNSGDRESNNEGGESNSGDGDSNSSGEDKRMSETETSTNEQQESEDSPSESTSNPDGGESKTDVDSSAEEDQSKDQASNEGFPAGAQSEILKETTADSGAWSTQAAESQSEKESQKSPLSKDQNGYKWKLCNVTAGPDYIPCLDNVQAIKKLPNTNHYEHRERHCPDEAPTCLVPLPEGYKKPVRWPRSREQRNTYNFHLIMQSLSKIAWGNRTRVILDVGCGVASFGGYLFDRDVLAMSLAPKDEHEAQVQFALERGIPAISAVMGTKRLPFPSKVFDVVHCARCRVPWHIEVKIMSGLMDVLRGTAGGKLLLELNRVLRPGGYFVWSATPVYQKLPEDVGIWKAMSELTKSMCWELLVVNNDKLNQVGVAIYRKPMSNQCYEKREQNEPPLCKEDDDPDAVWYCFLLITARNVQLQACMHKVPVGASDRGKQLPKPWPLRLGKPPYWLTSSQVGVYGKAAPEDFTADYEHWQRVVSTSYLNGLGIDWSSVRNVMDMRAVYGGFAAALRDLKVWAMNVVTIDSPDTLPLIYERGLFGIYHDWCESFSTYPRSYDLVHADHLFSNLKKRCKLQAVIAEVDRILRPEGKLIVRDSVETVAEVEKMAKSLQWKIRLTYSNDNEGLLCVQKTLWRPTEAETIFSAIA
ncbi:hypothetical protein RJ639_000065 [Escallonia herrerae]|uniref:Methyltransferase PMT26 n=1 Tax=Escallonia herrerae TaxID=1293975 RepID=A0AA89BH55_9ASTE|nr:hypothetical protein RJ639_000065 [Escallonia herrerae]